MRDGIGPKYLGLNLHLADDSDGFLHTAKKKEVMPIKILIG